MIFASPDINTHREHLSQVFRKLQQNGLSINAAKYKFAQEKVNYLGYTIDKQGIRPMEDRVEAIKRHKKPVNVSELRRFLGIINFYRRLIPNAAEV